MKKNRENCRKQMEKRGEGRSVPERKAVKSKTTFQSTWDYVPSDLRLSLFTKYLQWTRNFASMILFNPCSSPV